jgi:hypothetical protein
MIIQFYTPMAYCIKRETQTVFFLIFRLTALKLTTYPPSRRADARRSRFARLQRHIVSQQRHDVSLHHLYFESQVFCRTRRISYV